MEQSSLFDTYSDGIVRISKLLKKAMKIASKENDIEAIEKISLIESTMDAFAELLKSADPLLISSTYETSLTDTLNQIEAYLENYVEDSETYNSNLDTTLSQVDSIKNLFPYLIPKPSNIGIEYLRETVVNSRRSASQHLNNMSADFEEKIAEINETYSEKHQEIEEQFTEKQNQLEGTFAEKFTAFETQVKEKQDEFSETLAESLSEVKALNKLSNETTETINSQKDRLDSAIAEYQKQFSERVAEYQKQFSEGEEERRKKLEVSIQARDKAYAKETKERTTELNAWGKEFKENSEKLIYQLRDFAKEADVTVGLMSEKSLQNDFIIQADKEKNRAWMWNLATFVAIVLLLVAVGYIFVHTIISPLPTDQTSYPQILSKFLVTAVIGIIARWTSRQANRHLAEERRLRKLALELATINPFLNNLPDEIKFKVKEILAMRYYGNNSDEKAPFGEMTPIFDAEGGIKSIPETIVDGLRGKKN